MAASLSNLTTQELYDLIVAAHAQARACAESCGKKALAAWHSAVIECVRPEGASRAGRKLELTAVSRGTERELSREMLLPLLDSYGTIWREADLTGAAWMYNFHKSFIAVLDAELMRRGIAGLSVPTAPWRRSK